MRTRWAHCGIRVFVDGDEIDQFKAVNFSYDDELNVDPATYQGDTGPRLDAAANGGNGSIEFRLEHGFGDPTEVYERYIEGVKNLDGTGRVDFQVSRTNPRSGQKEARRFTNCQIRQAERGGENAPWAVTWNFQYEESKRT
jgi:hypothetical protein